MLVCAAALSLWSLGLQHDRDRACIPSRSNYVVPVRTPPVRRASGTRLGRGTGRRRHPAALLRADAHLVEQAVHDVQVRVAVVLMNTDGCNISELPRRERNRDLGAGVAGPRV